MILESLTRTAYRATWWFGSGLSGLSTADIYTDGTEWFVRPIGGGWLDLKTLRLAGYTVDVSVN